MQRKRRRRSGGNNNNNQNNPNRHYDSNGPDVRIRGSAQQILDKYLQYARDAQTAGDRIKAEALFQHAEHYARIVAVFERQKADLERQKEDQRKEREARDAEREAARTAQQEVADSAPDTGEALDAARPDEDTSDETTPQDSAVDAREEKPKRRRKPKTADPLQVIGEDNAPSEPANGSEEDETAVSVRPRRRAYTPQSTQEEAAQTSTHTSDEDSLKAHLNPKQTIPAEEITAD